MLILLLTSLLSSAKSAPAPLYPSFSEWTLLERSVEKAFFPIRDFILEIKSFLPEEYDVDPPYSIQESVDNSTRMMMILYSGNWNNKVGRLVWNTIKYDQGFDVAIEECDARYKPYNTFPAGRRKEQIWEWVFTDNDVELTCDGEQQYYQHFDKADTHPLKPWLAESCRALGDADVDRITFRHMEGCYVRARTRAPENLVLTQLPTTDTLPLPTTVPLPGDVEYPTCDCWTMECGYCTNLECTVQHDLVNSDTGIVVTSLLNRYQLNSIMLYDEAGVILGTFQWNLKSLLLTHCISSPTPESMKEAAAASVGLTTWELSFKDNAVTITIENKVVYRKEKMLQSCPARYSRVRRFAFYNMMCGNTFTFLVEEMQAGDQITPDCYGYCV